MDDMTHDGHVSKSCAACGQPLVRKRYRRGWETATMFAARKYCDRQCMALGFLRPDAGYSALKKRAADVLPVVNSCEKCGSIFDLHRHHLDENPANNDPTNLAVLCSSCHLKLHWRELGKQSKPKKGATSHGS